MKTIATGIATRTSFGDLSHTISAPSALPMKKVMVTEKKHQPDSPRQGTRDEGGNLRRERRRGEAEVECDDVPDVLDILNDQRVVEAEILLQLFQDPVGVLRPRRRPPPCGRA